MSQPATFGRFVRTALVMVLKVQAITATTVAFYFLFARLVSYDMDLPNWAAPLAGGLAIAAVAVTFIQYRRDELPERGSGWSRRRRTG